MKLTCAGFLLVKEVATPDGMGVDILPKQLLSASNCICKQFPGTYTLEWCGDSEESKVESFAQIGLLSHKRQEVTNWATNHFQVSFGWVGVFYTLNNAQTARELFFRAGELSLIGLGLPDEYVNTFLQESTPSPQQPGFAPMGETGWFATVNEQEQLPEGGVLLGYELLNVECGLLSHSWLCNGLEKHCMASLGIRPNEYGLINSLKEAKVCLAEITKEEVGAEPGLWLPWAIVRYT